MGESPWPRLVRGQPASDLVGLGPRDGRVVASVGAEPVSVDRTFVKQLDLVIPALDSLSDDRCFVLNPTGRALVHVLTHLQCETFLIHSHNAE